MLDTTTRPATMSAFIGDRNTVDEGQSVHYPDFSVTAVSETQGEHAFLGLGACSGLSVAGVVRG